MSVLADMGCDRPTFLALAALYEIASAAHDAPIKPSLMLRAVLALLYARSDRQREPYDAFWRTIQDPYEKTEAEWERRYLRATYARTEWYGIARSVGVNPLDPEFNEAIGRMIGGGARENG